MPLVCVGAVVKFRLSVEASAPPPPATKLTAAPAPVWDRPPAARVRLPPAPLFRLTVEYPAWTLTAPICSFVAALALPARVNVPPARFRAVPDPRRLLTLLAALSTRSVPLELT